MTLVQKNAKKIYIGGGWMNWEFNYDLRNWSLAWFQAAWGNNIDVNWSYGFDWNWIYLTSSWYDHWFALFVEIPDLSEASKITISATAYYIAWSRSNNKRLWISLWSARSNNQNFCALEQAYNTSSPWTYNWAWMRTVINNSETWIQRENVAFWTWDVVSTLEIDLTTWEIKWTITWANNKNYSWTLNSTQLEAIKSWKYVYFEKEEWYQYRWERLKDIHILVK